MPCVAGVSEKAAQAAEAVLADAKKRLPTVDEGRVYLIGPGSSAAEVFFNLSRTPDLWGGGLAIQGSPGQAINTYHLFAANTLEAPLLWISTAAEIEMYKQKLSAV